MFNEREINQMFQSMFEIAQEKMTLYVSEEIEKIDPIHRPYFIRAMNKCPVIFGETLKMFETSMINIIKNTPDKIILS